MRNFRMSCNHASQTARYYQHRREFLFRRGRISNLVQSSGTISVCLKKASAFSIRCRRKRSFRTSCSGREETAHLATVCKGLSHAGDLKHLVISLGANHLNDIQRLANPSFYAEPKAIAAQLAVVRESAIPRFFTSHPPRRSKPSWLVVVLNDHVAFGLIKTPAVRQVA